MVWEIILLFKMTRTVLKLVRWFSLKFVHVNAWTAVRIYPWYFIFNYGEGGGVAAITKELLVEP